jgi:hypothetical protein
VQSYVPEKRATQLLSAKYAYVARKICAASAGSEGEPGTQDIDLKALSLGYASRDFGNRSD